MAKTKSQSASAARRREQVREQRQQRINAGQNTQQNQGRRTSRRRTRSSNNPWFLIGGILVMVVVVIGIFLFLQQQQQQQATVGKETALNDITHLNTSLFSQTGTGSANNLFHSPPSSIPPVTGPNGKPQVLYIGGDYCPYCAAQRWPLIIALSRFGTFGHLDQIQSAELNISTFSFHQGSYTSQYVDFAGVETADNNQKALDAPTVEQQKLFTTYDTSPYTSSPGSIPFIMIGNQYFSIGSYYDPQLLVSLSYGDIVNQIRTPNSDISKAVIGSANYITAAICSATNNQPANVCTADPIPSIQKSLTTVKAFTNPAGAQLGFFSNPVALVPGRED